MNLFAWRRPDGTFVDGNVTRMRAAARADLEDGPFVLTRDGVRISVPRERSAMIEKLTTVLKASKVGPTYRVRDRHDEVVFIVRLAVPALEIIDTSGNAHADEYWTWVVDEYEKFHPRFAGAYVCKDVAGASTPSQHSYGNAVDVFFDSLAHQEAVYRAAKNGDCPTPVAHAISGTHIWSPSGGEDPYGGEFHAHLHVDFLPQYSGPCGVRG